MIFSCIPSIDLSFVLITLNEDIVQFLVFEEIDHSNLTFQKNILVVEIPR